MRKSEIKMKAGEKVRADCACIPLFFKRGSRENDGCSMNNCYPKTRDG
ncbi:hypothetical protein D1BOALGB6SA_4516 [Olavius sp. associated proteobacterium Delta 1]|nr:hypothetical protein D1BOALGB6SA_4516 [Olavius sp. associated proteobacterium Delta 1]